jgi:hypothetical protein
MTNDTLTTEERQCLQMWFRQAIVEAEKKEALAAITRFYQGDAKSRDAHKSHVVPRRNARTRGARSHELV